MPTPLERLIFAVDVPDRAGAERVLSALTGRIGVAKLGLELFVGEGPAIVAVAHERKLPVFLDLKLHDIPATVDRAVARACDLGVKFLTVHASGATAMLEQAVRRTEGTNTTIVAVTVLTSLSEADLRAIGSPHSPAELAPTLARVAASAGVTAFVCSPHEAKSIRSAVGPSATIITPGVRPAGSDAGDQKRVATVGEAITAGADYLVVGRPIRDAADPRHAADDIVAEIARSVRS